MGVWFLRGVRGRLLIGLAAFGLLMPVAAPGVGQLALKRIATLVE